MELIDFPVLDNVSPGNKRTSDLLNEMDSKFSDLRHFTNDMIKSTKIGMKWSSGINNIADEMSIIVKQLVTENFLLSGRIEESRENCQAERRDNRRLAEKLREAKETLNKRYYSSNKEISIITQTPKRNLLTTPVIRESAPQEDPSENANKNKRNIRDRLGTYADKVKSTNSNQSNALNSRNHRDTGGKDNKTHRRDKARKAQPPRPAYILKVDPQKATDIRKDIWNDLKNKTEHLKYKLSSQLIVLI